MEANENDNKSPTLASFEDLSETSEKSLNTTSKRRKIHMSEADCFSYTSSEDGGVALSHPKDLTRNSSVDVNSKLQPVHRKRKKQQCEFNNVGGSCGLNRLGDMPNSQGFVSAKNMYNIAGKSVTGSLSKRTKNSPGKPVLSKKGILTNQSSILSFISSSPSTLSSSTDESNSTCTNDLNADNELVSKPKRTVMYSPIKRLGATGTIYISDTSPSSSPVSSQGSSNSVSIMKDNAVVKQLFEAQKHMDGISKTKPSKSKSATRSKFITRKSETMKSEPTVFNSLETDSFDLSGAFNSDLEEAVPDKYGLLGSGHYPSGKGGENYFEQLPPEVLENIFCQLPMLDLCLNSNRVCLSWNNIIANEKVCTSKLSNNAL